MPDPSSAARRTGQKRSFLADLEPKYVAIGAAVVIAVLGIWYVLLRDPGSSVDAGPEITESEAENPIDAAGAGAAGLELQTALVTATNAALQSGGYEGVTVEALQAQEPGLTWVPGDQPAGPGEVSVRVVDPQSIVLVTATPDGTCRATYVSPPGTVDLIPPGPCTADNVAVGGEAPGAGEG